MAYKKCPRCNLNYIKETDILCKVCVEDLSKKLGDNGDEEEYDICPECGENIIRADESMCYDCMVESLKEDVKKQSKKLDEDEWDIYADDESDSSDDLIIDNDDIDSLEELDESEDIELEDEFVAEDMDNYDEDDDDYEEDDD
ncbi:MAG TPA: hypothetical protein GX392_00870 [Clostridiales bacterium]|nr:hypothetical protein [Clostridiales bacterium]